MDLAIFKALEVCASLLQLRFKKMGIFWRVKPFYASSVLYQGLGSAMRGKIVQLSNFMDDCVDIC
jgi:hypothetical protein